MSKSHPDLFTSHYRGFNLRIDHPRKGLCRVYIDDPTRPDERPEVILDRAARDAIDFAIRWIDGIYLDNPSRNHQTPPTPPPPDLTRCPFVAQPSRPC